MRSGERSRWGVEKRPVFGSGGGAPLCGGSAGAFSAACGKNGRMRRSVAQSKALRAAHAVRSQKQASRVARLCRQEAERERNKKAAPLRTSRAMRRLLSVARKRPAPAGCSSSAGLGRAGSGREPTDTRAFICPTRKSVSFRSSTSCAERRGDDRGRMIRERKRSAAGGGWWSGARRQQGKRRLKGSLAGVP